MSIFFWVSFIILFYTYIGYGLIVWLLLSFKKQKSIIFPIQEAALPNVTLLVAAYNEAGIIQQKIQNTFELDYPADKLNIIFVTDGSDDETPRIIKEYTDIILLHQHTRRGKIAAVQRAMPYVCTPLIIFSDANTFLNREAIRNLVKHFSDPQVGAVAGEKRVWIAAKDKANAAGEGLYWKYESWLKQQDAVLGTVVGAAGELFAIRTDLFEPVPTDTIIEDFYMTLRIAKQGYRVAYAPDAYALEYASADAGEEIKRKIRISAGGFQAMARLKSLLNPFKYNILSFQYISHRVLRWTLAPLTLPVLLITNGILALHSSFYLMLFLLQVIFYMIALIGYLMQDKSLKIKGFSVPFYFVLMNVCVYFGFIKYLKKQQSVVWEKAKRADVIAEI